MVQNFGQHGLLPFPCNLVFTFIYFYVHFLYLQEDEELDTRDRRSWDDDYVLKRQFSALIPAFDPRPGRPNINQTQDFEIPAPGSEVPSSPPVSSDVPPAPKLVLTLSAPCLPGVSGIRLSVACLSPLCQSPVHLSSFGLFSTCCLSVSCLSPACCSPVFCLSYLLLVCPFPFFFLSPFHLSSVSFLPFAYLFPISLLPHVQLSSVSFLPVACLFPVSLLLPVHLSSFCIFSTCCLSVCFLSLPCLLFTCLLYLFYLLLVCLFPFSLLPSVHLSVSVF